MKYSIYLILFFTFICVSSPAISAKTHYRVEILVLSHLHHEAIAKEVPSLRDFSESLDFLAPEPDQEEEERLASETEIDMDESVADDALPEGEETEEDPWADVVPVETMGEVMQESWRRLRLSAPFRPQQYLSWEQSADEPFPSLRIHNQQVVLTDDPYAELREQVPGEGGGAGPTVVFSDQGNTLPGDAEEQETELPDPTLFYQLDGTITLRRSRFLHLDIDIETREPIYREPIETQPIPDQPQPINEEPEERQPDAFDIHSLKQSRQVKSKRMEYFDSPVLGVLAWITSFEVEEEPEETSE